MKTVRIITIYDPLTEDRETIGAYTDKRLANKVQRMYGAIAEVEEIEVDMAPVNPPNRWSASVSPDGEIKALQCARAMFYSDTSVDQLRAAMMNPKHVDWPHVAVFYGRNKREAIAKAKKAWKQTQQD
jgi:hypothetical protein